MWWLWTLLVMLGGLVVAPMLVTWRYAHRGRHPPPWNGPGPRISGPQPRIARERLDDLNARRAALGKPTAPKIRYVGDGAATTDEDIPPSQPLNTDHDNKRSTQ
ncbi:hypothetical protein GCM10023214_57980 [Amycolatopsis dongchuanensis]|uniref:Uncharacterized protein n=1 Tax=Amycolatopsis dongchuanensis TaxID=1070866 RepID=A0ABP8VBG8_9PSEU